MSSLTGKLSGILGRAFEKCGFDGQYGKVIRSNRPDLCQFQCNGAMAAARACAGKLVQKAPGEVAREIIAAVEERWIFQDISVAGPGFINITLTDDFLADYIQDLGTKEKAGVEAPFRPLKIIVDYGGANIAKPLHVGHLRSAIIGECLKRLGRFLGHEVIGDIHLGDWGLQMGMIISELERRRPDLPYFNPDYDGPYPKEAPFSIADLETIYPEVSKRAKEDGQILEAARQATFELQKGRPGYLALWRHIYNISVADLKADYHKLNIDFDLWLGESSTRETAPAMVERLKEQGYVKESQGALVIPVARPEDQKEIPPLILVKSDGAILYGTTDLATIEQRMRDFAPDVILYVVDKRQGDHFLQVFRGAYLTQICPETVSLEHIGFGTMNGVDGRPFKTRDGGVMKLKDLIGMITGKAMERVQSSELGRDFDADQKAGIARMIGVATLKYADLMNHRLKDYVFDLERFSAFEGCTGPYLLYVAVRIKSILNKAKERGFAWGRIQPPGSAEERDLFLRITEFADIAVRTFEDRAPNYLCDYVYQLAVAFNHFYHEHHILAEKDPKVQASWLNLSRIVLRILELTLDILGIEVPERM
ncbi:MAG: arginine--tRNA ligase [Firmicutes bacterium]|nr:arginine--tRNA ligase [Bacillota bacterium]